MAPDLFLGGGFNSNKHVSGPSSPAAGAAPRRTGGRQLHVEEIEEWQVVSKSVPGNGAAAGKALHKANALLGTTTRDNLETSIEEGVPQQMQQACFEGPRRVGQMSMGMEQQYQSTCCEKELTSVDMRERGSSMEIDAGLATDTSSYGAGEDEQGGLPEDYEEVDYEDEEDEDLLSPPVFCINCTGRMRAGECEDCGHTSAEDSSIFWEGGPQGDQQHLSEQAAAASRAAAAGVAAHEHQQGQGIVLVWDERMELHEEGKVCPHPERPDRVRAVMSRILASNLAERCTRVDCPEAPLEALQAVHSGELISFVRSLATEHGPGATPPPDLCMTSDMYANAHTFHCARLAAGGAAEVACRVVKGEAAHGVAIVRPPGHHAESSMAMGFCFFNSAAVAARAAQGCGAQRVLILDWDVHHGNGTQHIFEDDPTVMYMSLHRHDHGNFFPGTGAAHEVGTGPGRGFTINVAWDCGGIQNGDYLAAFTHLLLPIAYEFAPDLIIVSAGFDAAEGDPIGGCRLTSECFSHMTALLKAVAPLALVLEGGYNLRATAAATEACLRALLGQQPPALPGPKQPTMAGMRAIRTALQVQAAHWNCVRTALALACPYPAYGMDYGSMMVDRDDGGLEGSEEEEDAESDEEGEEEGSSEGGGGYDWDQHHGHRQAPASPEQEEGGVSRHGGNRTQRWSVPQPPPAKHSDNRDVFTASRSPKAQLPGNAAAAAAAAKAARPEASRCSSGLLKVSKMQQLGEGQERLSRSAITALLSKIRKRAVRTFWRRRAARLAAAARSKGLGGREGRERATEA